MNPKQISSIIITIIPIITQNPLVLVVLAIPLIVNKPIGNQLITQIG